MIKKGEEAYFITNTFNFSNGTLNCSIRIPDNTFIANEVEFYIYAKFNQPVIWNNNKVNFKYYYSNFDNLTSQWIIGFLIIIQT